MISPSRRRRFIFRATLGYAALSGLLFQFTHQLFAAESSQAELSSGQKLAHSIRNEALTGSASIGTTPGLIDRYAGRVAGFVTTQANSGDPSRAPELGSLLPTVPLTLADGRVKGTLSASSSSLSYDGDETRANLDFGLGYYDSERGGESVNGRIGIATLVGDTFALGGSAVIYRNRYDLLLSTLWQLPGTGFRLRVSGGYIRGDQSFAFPSGEAEIGLEQYSYLLASTWVPNDDTGWLHSAGVSLWGARANQTSSLDPVFYTTETPTDYIIWRDPLKVAEGRLFGVAADMQAELSGNLVAKGSIGYEELKYPFADGSKEQNRSLYTSLALAWEPVEAVTIGMDWKAGAGEQRYGMSLSGGHWRLESWYSSGRNGIGDDKGAMLCYSLAIPYGGSSQSLARRMRPGRSTNPQELLTEAQRRPSQLPNGFLAKVDLTAVTAVASVSKAGLPGGVTVDDDGNVLAPVGTDGLTITSVTRNGTAFASSGIIEAVGNNLVIRARALPDGVATYIISATDGTPTAYLITMVTE